MWLIGMKVILFPGYKLSYKITNFWNDNAYIHD